MKNTKKWLWIISIIAIAFTAITCKDEEEAHTHNWGAWAETTAATCVAKGVETRICNECKEKETKDIPVDSSNHDMKLVSGTAPTCEDDGDGKEACARAGCDHTYEGVLPKLGHHMTATGKDFVSATCLEDGSEEKACDNEGCDRTEAGDKINALTHSYGAWSIHTNETCIADGTDERFCTRKHNDATCDETGYRDTRPRPTPGHKWQYDAGATVATCTQPGSGNRHCTANNCNETSTGGTYPALTHLWRDLDWDTTKQPTCTANGDRERTCARPLDPSVPKCTEKQTETNTINVPARGHDWAAWMITKHPTCMANGDRERECNRTGCTVKDIETNTSNVPAYGSHYYIPTTPATCTTASVPHNCSRQLHRVGQADYICNNTNPEDIVPALKHDWNWTANAIAATCTTAAKDTATCKNTPCTETNVRDGTAALGHQTWNWTTYNSSTGHVSCNRTGCSGGLAKIGDTGPAGGIIFYVVTTGFTVQGYTGSFAEYTAYYLEAAPANASTSTMSWSGTNVLTPNLSLNLSDTTDRAIGRGRLNTALIIAAHSADTTDNNAAKACDAYSNGDKTDWFLPSREELNQMYLARTHLSITAGWFWSSSQHSFSNAWYQFFLDGFQYENTSKGSGSSVRAIRAF